MTDNKALWNRVCVTDPKHVKAITGKQYKGNSPKPYWIVERLTEEFGPCGIGWGFTILNERMERLSETDLLHVAVVRLWYVLDGKRGELEQIGQTRTTYKKSDGGLMVDEDAPKKSVTDALVKCASYIGFAGDIFAGRWDDSKYVAEANKEWRAREKEAGVEETPAPPVATAIGQAISATRLAYEALSVDMRAWIDDWAVDVINTIDQAGPAAAVELIQTTSEKNELDPNHLVALYHKLPSNVRTAIDRLTKSQPVKKVA